MNSKQRILRSRTLLDVDEEFTIKQTLLRMDTKLDLRECLSPKKRNSISPNSSPKKPISTAKSPVKMRLLSPNSKSKILRQGTESDLFTLYAPVVKKEPTAKRNLLLRKDTVLENINESFNEDKENSTLAGFIICQSHDYAPIILHYHSDKKVSVGRHNSCTVKLAESIVSGRHCIFTVEKETRNTFNIRGSIVSPQKKKPNVENAPHTFAVWIEDTSSNGTYINDVALGKGQRKKLEEGDTISLAKPSIKQDKDLVCFKFTKDPTQCTIKSLN